MFFKVLATILFTSSFSSSTLLLSNNENVLKGFHITVKSNNTNTIKAVNTWNTINTNYQRFVQNHLSKNLINIQFNSWDEITNYFESPNQYNIGQQVLQQFNQQLSNKDNNILPTGKQTFHFDNNIIGSSIATNNFNPAIKSFGSVYLPYYDDIAPTVNNGVFATINGGCKYSNYFPIPYTIQPSDNLLKDSINNRLEVIALGRDNWNPTNERQLVILAKNDDEKLSITYPNNKDENVIINESNNLAYALVNHRVNDINKETNFNISVKKNDTDEFSKPLSLTNNTSNIEFEHNENNKDYTPVSYNYLIQTTSDNKNLITMNKSMGNAKVTLPENEQWSKYYVDQKTLMIDQSSKTLVKDQELLTNTSGTEYQIYYLAKQIENLPEQNDSGQYIVIYNKEAPKLNNCTNLKDDKNKKLLNGFQQYLSNISNNMKFEDLSKNSSQFITYFVAYMQDIKTYHFINYFGQSQTEPWKINVQLQITTLVNNWATIFYGVTILLVLIITFIVFLIKSKKHIR